MYSSGSKSLNKKCTVCGKILYNGNKYLRCQRHPAKEYLNKLSESLKGNKNSLGIKHTEKTIEKMRETHKGLHMGKNNPMYGYTGSKNPNWKGGIYPITKLIRASLKYSEWKQNVFIRDNFTCVKCDKRGGDLHAHHKKEFHVLLQEATGYFPLLNIYDAAMLYTPLWDITNGLTECPKCHKKEHKNK
jgi:hypothetical protein